MGNLLIYSAADNFSVWPPVRPRCRPCRASRGRKLIRHGQCGSSLATRRAARPTPWLVWLLASCLSGSGQQFIVDNRPGPGGNIGTEAVVRSQPAGYTLLLIFSGNAINATFYDKLDFNFIRDIRPVASIARSPFVMEVHPSVPVKTVPEFIAYAKANPGKVRMRRTVTVRPPMSRASYSS